MTETTLHWYVTAEARQDPNMADWTDEIKKMFRQSMLRQGLRVTGPITVTWEKIDELWLKHITPFALHPGTLQPGDWLVTARAKTMKEPVLHD